MSDISTNRPENQDPSTPPAATVPQPRIWPLIVIAALLLAAITIPGQIAPSTLFHFMSLMWGALIGMGLTGLWLVAFSQIPWKERLGAIALVTALILTAIFLSHSSMNAMVLGVVIFPWTVVACGAVALLAIPLGWSVQRAALVAVMVTTTVLVLCLRMEGVRGTITADFAPRWSPTTEETLLANQKETSQTQAAPDAESLTAATSFWPGFRGPQRDGVVRGVTFATDWDKEPPKELWRRSVGPGWSSFCVIGQQIVTQEQRGEEELVTCYDASTGEPVWQYAIETRFEEPLAGPGPRATPTFHNGKLFTQGGSGYVSCINAADGAEVWQRDLVEDLNAKTPEWGFSGSPLVVGNLVIAFAGDQSKADKSVVAYDAETGDLKWTAGKGKHSYCSPHLAKLGGVDQVIMISDWGVQGIAPADGKILWENEWDIEPGNRVVQPQIVADSVYVGTGLGMGTRKLDIKHAAEAWSATEEWTSRNLKPYFNDFVQLDGHFYGFDDRIFTCIDVATGDRIWKGGRYGHGQTLLVEDAKVLIVVSEDGELALVQATPEGHEEITKFRVFANKTWNHPVVADGKLFLRNGEEMACFELRDWQETKKADE
ncbi:PQQ-binding-like beta-propeller repeat protein [Blastopirellula sp. JC732]|uniref:PQQ-binding-like beta-propeller repeat protein n=1 Tax=Blastopirellula sediminis TaxID=2894196 RepID=A0A9X1SEE8_9BACT|nr:PQQ-binding-like beta-propeller repeat protein [Blastopirellula sediminis]MCC9609448.1 PQQ-binding-like beta-propeller repeat protein [Blastopirellula sediminis]MCC9627775.1 PQQ-binding-like beta-propeller repeat protein [Blastopirellula sediminis]